MGYDPREMRQQFKDKKKRYFEQITLGQRVQATLSTKGWQEVIKPLIEKMIVDVVGGKQGDTWNNGLLSRARSDEKREFYIGYKQFGIDLYNRVQAYVYNIQVAENKIKEIQDIESSKTVKQQISSYDRSKNAL